MKKLLDRSTITFMGKVIIITLLIVFVFRCFFFEFYTISTSQMESTLLKGDEVLVSKISYGPRLPITPLSVPFAFNKFYSDRIQLPCKRFFAAELLRNDIVLFNSPSELNIPIDKRNLLISRCVAVPSDTIMLSNEVYYINGKEYVHSPTQINEYVALSDNYANLLKLADRLSVDIQTISNSNDSVYFLLNRYDAHLLNSYAEVNSFYRKEYIIPQTLIFIVPSVDRKVSLTPNNIKLYKQIIAEEQGSIATFENDALYINGERIDVYTFEDDYYWMLSDNTVGGLDSRDLGFIPFRNVVGRATYVLYSKGKSGLRGDRFLKAIE